MDDEPRVSLKSPGGLELAAQGTTVVLVVVLVVGFLGLGWITRDGLVALQRTQTEILTTLRSGSLEHHGIETAQRDLACILALPADSRPEAIAHSYGACHYVSAIYLPRLRGRSDGSR